MKPWPRRAVADSLPKGVAGLRDAPKPLLSCHGSKPKRIRKYSKCGPSEFVRSPTPREKLPPTLDDLFTWGTASAFRCLDVCGCACGATYPHRRSCPTWSLEPTIALTHIVDTVLAMHTCKISFLEKSFFLSAASPNPGQLQYLG